MPGYSYKAVFRYFCKIGDVIITSNYSNKNTLKIFQKDDGDIVISTYIRDKNDKNY